MYTHHKRVRGIIAFRLESPWEVLGMFASYINEMPETHLFFHQEQAILIFDYHLLFVLLCIGECICNYGIIGVQVDNEFWMNAM